MSDPIPESDWPAKCCANCHFMAKMATLDGNSRSPYELSRKDRVQLAGGEAWSTVAGKGRTIVCYLGVWDQGYMTVDGLDKSRAEVITGERGESCFFYTCTPGMFFPAAAELEKRASDRREAERDRHVVKWGIIIGIAGVVLGALLASLLK